MTVRIDGTYVVGSAPPPKPPPPPPPPKRVQDVQARDTGGSADAMERRAQAHKPLADAASNTQKKVAAAADAKQTVKDFDKLPPQQRKQLQGEYNTARADANRAEQEARAAIAAELEIARATLSPSYYEQYVAAMERDFQGDEDQAEVVHSALKALAPETLAHAQADAAAEQIADQQTAVRKAEERYYQLLSNGSPSDAFYTYVVDPARQKLDVERAKLDTLLKEELTRAAATPRTNPFEDPLDTRARELAAIAPNDTGFAEAVERARQAVVDERAATPAVESIERTFQTRGADAANAEFLRQASWMSDSQRALLEQRLAHVIDPQAAEAAYQVQAAYESGGAVAASEKLDQLTATMSPEQAARTLQIADGTINRIVADLGDRYKHDDDPNTRRVETEEWGTFGPEKKVHYEEDPSNQIEFDAIVGHLSAAVERAGNDPVNGEAVAANIAAKIVAEMGDGKAGRFDESFETSVVNGNGAALGLAIVENLKNQGRIEHADDILQNIVDGAKTLEKEVEQARKDFIQHNQYYFFLKSQAGQLAPDQATLDKALKAFTDAEDKTRPGSLDGADKFDGKKFKQDLENLQAKSGQLGAVLFDLSVARETGVITDAMGHADDVDKLLGEFATDPSRAQILSTDQVQAKLDALLAKAERGDPEAKGFFERLKEDASVASAGRSVLKDAADIGLTLGAHYVLSLAKAGNQAEAAAQLEKFKRFAPYIGVPQDDWNKGIEALKEFQLPATASKEEVKEATEALFEELTKSGFDETTKGGRFLAGLGLGLNLVGVAAAAESLEAGDVSSWLTFGTETVNTAKGLTTLATSFIGNTDEFFKAHPTLGGINNTIGVAGKIAGVIGVLLEAHSTAEAFQSGDYWGGSLGAAGAVGGSLLLGAEILGPGGAAIISGTAASWWTGVGIVLTIGATVGVVVKGIVDRGNEVTKFQKQETVEFLVSLGFDRDTANELKDQDGDGYSPIPVLALVRDKLMQDPNSGIHTPQEFNDFLDGLSADQVKALVKAAQHVDPNDKGDYKQTANNDVNVETPNSKPTRYVGGRGGSYPVYDNDPHSINGMILWMKREGLIPA